MPPGLPELPAEVEAIAARQRAGSGSNLAFLSVFQRRYKGYGWNMTAFKARPSAPTAITIGFAWEAAQHTQLQASQFSWTLGRRALRGMDRNLKPVSLDTGRGMGSNGSIVMRLSDPEPLIIQRAEGCTGFISIRLGRLSGRFRFHARDEYFQRVGLDRPRVILYREHDLRCDYGEPEELPPICDQLAFGAVDTENGVSVSASRTPPGRVFQAVVVARKSGDADSVHVIHVEIAVPEAFEASDDATTAQIDGDAAGPWLSGDLSYVAPPASAESNDECGPYVETSGIVTGDYTAHFDSIGPVSPAVTGVPATLRRDL